jgi:hypothetical protein
VEFSLRYKGPLPANSGPREKHAIRRALHPQLLCLWNQHPILEGAAKLPLIGVIDREDINGEKPCEPRKRFVRATRVEWIASEYQRGSYYFAPLVSKALDLVCNLDIQFFRREAPGALIHGGDIDNRIKTLFDALRVPDESQVEKMAPEEGETPFFCLLQDDALVTGFAVKTERLLEPAEAGERASDVALTINQHYTSVRNGGVRSVEGPQVRRGIPRGRPRTPN